MCVCLRQCRESGTFHLRHLGGVCPDSLTALSKSVIAALSRLLFHVPEGLKAILFFLPLMLWRKNWSLSRSPAVALLLGSGSKQRRMKDLASGERDSGISGWILNIPTWKINQTEIVR